MIINERRLKNTSDLIADQQNYDNTKNSSKCELGRNISYKSKSNKERFVRAMYDLKKIMLELTILFIVWNFDLGETVMIIRTAYTDFIKFWKEIYADIIKFLAMFLKFLFNMFTYENEVMFLICDGDIEEFTKKFCNKKSNKKIKDPVICWDEKNNVKFKTSLTIIDILKWHAKTNKMKKKIKRAINYEKHDDVYIVLTDLCNSTHLWNTDRFKMAKVIKEHDKIFYKYMEQNNGIELRNEGDSFLAVFFTKDECLNFVHGFYKDVSDISYDDDTKVGVKIAVSYDKLSRANTNRRKYCKTIVDQTYKMSEHSTIDRICINHSVVESEENQLYCIH